MQKETDAIINLAGSLHQLRCQRKITLSDTEAGLIVAREDLPGSIYDTMKSLNEENISYAEMGHSYEHLPECDCALEIQKFEFQRKGFQGISGDREIYLPPQTKKNVVESLKRLYPDFDPNGLEDLLRLFWHNNPKYIEISPPERIGRVLWLYRQCITHEGLYLNVEKTESNSKYKESRLLFSVRNPTQSGFLTQISEVFQRLDIGVRRSYCLNIIDSGDAYLLGTFYVTPRSGGLLEKEPILYNKLKNELYNTQILSTRTDIYKNFVINQILTGEEASLANALISFCHTTLAHNNPNKYSMAMVRNAFKINPEMVLTAINIFKNRFQPGMKSEDRTYEKDIDLFKEKIRNYNTGQQHIDEIRRTIFYTCLLFIRHVLKTNLFVKNKQALAFRLDPSYLKELGREFTSDLPDATPFRITFFFEKFGLGYHIGFSDIARGGWRSILCRNRDELIGNTNTLFREVFTLAHTQHLKNKDIYEGGSKLVIIINAAELESGQEITRRLYKAQSAFTNAFLDLFVTASGKACDPDIVDYFGEDEPIELGPDENMHDAMIEWIAAQSVKRNYLLGSGIMSSKKAGINHKAYGVTSRGVVTFAEIAMKQIGINIFHDKFSVRLTGGPNGDVAGNSLNLLIQRCPRINILSIVDGTAGLYDPEGADCKGLEKIVLKHDLDHFDPELLHTGGYIIYRNHQKQEGVCRLFKKVERANSFLTEKWITADEFHREMSLLIFSVPTDLFLPCGGRPETINDGNWEDLFFVDGESSVKVIVEGANSFITPSAREAIKKRGVILLKDASANKCGVISSSYEIIANLLMTDGEFIPHKEAYVQDVLMILEKRAKDEADLIFQQHEASKRQLLFTDISDKISEEINAQSKLLFDFFLTRPRLAEQKTFINVMLSHLPNYIQQMPDYRNRIDRLPPKIKYAILASEIALNIIYRKGWEEDLESRLTAYVKKNFSG